MVVRIEVDIDTKGACQSQAPRDACHEQTLNTIDTNLANEPTYANIRHTNRHKLTINGRQGRLPTANSNDMNDHNNMHNKYVCVCIYIYIYIYV